MISTRRGAADAVGCSSGVSKERLAKCRESALELTRKSRQVVYHQRQLWVKKKIGDQIEGLLEVHAFDE